MAFNFSRLEDTWCIFLADSNATDSISGYYTVTHAYSLCCHLASGTHNSGCKCAHFGGNLEEPVSQVSILCSSCWFCIYRLLQWVTKPTILCCVQTGGGCGTERSRLHCWR